MEINLHWRVMHICQHVYISFVFPHYCCQVNPLLSILCCPLTISGSIKNL
jgi:hypothetical protein